MSVLAWEERGLHLPAPPPPAFIVHEGETVAEERGHAGGGRPLGVGARIVLEHALDVLGMAHEVDVVDAEPHRDEIAVAARAIEEEARAGRAVPWGRHPREDSRRDLAEPCARGRGPCSCPQAA